MFAKVALMLAIFNSATNDLATTKLATLLSRHLYTGLNWFGHKWHTTIGYNLTQIRIYSLWPLMVLTATSLNFPEDSIRDPLITHPNSPETKSTAIFIRVVPVFGIRFRYPVTTLVFISRRTFHDASLFVFNIPTGFLDKFALLMSVTLLGTWHMSNASIHGWTNLLNNSHCMS